MYIQKIKIQNFKCFGELFEIDLNEKINILVGNNEAGKTTIIEAIHLVLSGWFKGRYINNELTEYLFNKVKVEEYLDSLKGDGGIPKPPPKIIIELFLSNNAPAIFQGSNNSERRDTPGLKFIVEFDNSFLNEYSLLIQSGSIHSLPIEYYNYHWESFARDEKVTPRAIPLKSALIDSGNNRQQNGSDLYIGRIVKDFLETKEVVDVSQAHRKMKDVFKNDKSIKSINEKIQLDSLLSLKKIELSVELSTKNAWESSLVTYIDNIPFHHIGMGEQSIIKTKLALSHKKALEANILLIEEPENHLSHVKLNELLKNIQQGSAEKQIIISTHSSFVANKLGLDNLVLLNDLKTMKLKDLDKDTHNFFQKLSGYDTLRLVLCDKVILVEGDSDELVVQKAFLKKYRKLPIEAGIDIISVGTSFLRFLAIAEKIKKETVVITDTDWDLEILEKKYSNYINENKKAYITISYDKDIDRGDLVINGKNFNYNTLEPKILKFNSLSNLNKVFGKEFQETDEMLKYMKLNKTECALDIFESDEEIIFPDYIEKVL